MSEIRSSGDSVRYALNVKEKAWPDMNLCKLKI
jgi:hypothetical protein